MSWSSTEPLECLDEHPDNSGCEGEVAYHTNPYSMSLKAWPRCVKHYDEYLTRMEGINQRYPDSPIPPPGFDPSYAGERWDDDY